MHSGSRCGAFVTFQQGDKIMAYQTSKAKRRAITTVAKGDAPNTGSPGPTPGPTKKYVNPILTERVEPTGYGQAKNLGPSSVEPGVTETSGLADELRRVAAESDAGDLLAAIADHGTARNASVDLQSKQTRDVPDDLRNVHPAMKRQTTPSKVGDVVVGQLPSTVGASAAKDPTDPNA
jgi:hypothetical protein